MDWSNFKHRLFAWMGSTGSKLMLVAGVLFSMAWAICRLEREYGHTNPLFVDKVLLWTFTVFAIGAAQLFVLLILLSIWGRIDLPRVFQDKSEAITAVKDATPSVSLSRLQAFMWTLVLMVVYFHRVVADDKNRIPAVPPEFLMLMGISGALYLTSKQMDNTAADKKAEREKGDTAALAKAAITGFEAATAEAEKADKEAEQDERAAEEAEARALNAEGDVKPTAEEKARLARKKANESRTKAGDAQKRAEEAFKKVSEVISKGPKNDGSKDEPGESKAS